MSRRGCGGGVIEHSLNAASLLPHYANGWPPSHAAQPSHSAHPRRWRGGRACRWAPSRAWSGGRSSCTGRGTWGSASLQVVWVGKGRSARVAAHFAGQGTSARPSPVSALPAKPNRGTSTGREVNCMLSAAAPGLALTSSTCSPYRMNRQSPQNTPCGASAAGGNNGQTNTRNTAASGRRFADSSEVLKHGQALSLHGCKTPNHAGRWQCVQPRAPSATRSRSRRCACPASSAGTGGTSGRSPAWRKGGCEGCR